jgi:hypothetical protein
MKINGNQIEIRMADRPHSDGCAAQPRPDKATVQKFSSEAKLRFLALATSVQTDRDTLNHIATEHAGLCAVAEAAKVLVKLDFCFDAVECNAAAKEMKESLAQLAAVRGGKGGAL